METIRKALPFLNPRLTEEFVCHATLAQFAKGTQLLREDQYIKLLPIVISGLVKVSARFEDRELLLYYIQPRQSCVMSFSAALQNSPSKVFAIAEEDSEILLLPAEKLPQWLKDHPDFNRLFYAQYDLRYTELLDTIRHVLIDTMDKRLFDYLKQKAALSKQKTIGLSHGQIANELGTAREVITRVIKKLESEGKIIRAPNGLRIA